MASQSGVEQTPRGWRIRGGALVMEILKDTGSVSSLVIDGAKPFDWTRWPGDVTVRDDLLRHEFDRRDLARARCEQRGGALFIEKSFTGAPWRLREEYTLDHGAIAWKAEVDLPSGDFRSCAVNFRLPWPQPLHSMKFWAARTDMPSAPHRFAEIALEYGEVTSGVLIPALCSYLEKHDAGLLVAMPFDFKTPRFSFVSGLRDPDLVMRFDWLALAPGRPAAARLLLRGTGGAWRPALGWLYERNKGYFEPRSTLIDRLWGGHVCGAWDVTDAQARAMADLGLAWFEIHEHFPAYGNYHPEGVAAWRPGHERKKAEGWVALAGGAMTADSDAGMVTVEKVRQAIRVVHAAGAAAMPYIQVTGDGDDARLDPAFEGSALRTIQGERFCAWPKTHLMNSDPSLPFGKDIARQIDGMVSRYPEMDGVFADQLCYNILDTAHDDGVTAVNNRPAYMCGFNYAPHLEHLSRLLHPHKAIIGNGPFSVGLMPWVDGFMAEGSGWLCDHFQYLALAKPMFFLMYDSSDRNVEMMFQRCLLHGAGYTSYPAAAPSKDLYRKYAPVLQTLFGRRWVFDPRPIETPPGFQGNVFRARGGAFVASVVSDLARLPGRRAPDNAVRLACKGMEEAARVTLHCPGEAPRDVSFRKEGGAVVFDLPDNTVAAVAEVALCQENPTT